MEIFESFAIFHTVGLEINPGGLLFPVLQMQSVRLKQVITIKEPFFLSWTSLCIIYLKNTCQLPQLPITNYVTNLLYYIDVPLHVSITNSRSEAGNIHKYKITIDLQF
jgi:hypothetical protein